LGVDPGDVSGSPSSSPLLPPWPPGRACGCRENFAQARLLKAGNHVTTPHGSSIGGTSSSRWLSHSTLKRQGLFTPCFLGAFENVLPFCRLCRFSFSAQSNPFFFPAKQLLGEKIALFSSYKRFPGVLGPQGGGGEF